MSEEKPSTTLKWMIALFIGVIGTGTTVFWWVQPVFELMGNIEPALSSEHKALFIFIGVIGLAFTIGYWSIFFFELKHKSKTD
jgi:hypothetical protein